MFMQIIYAIHNVCAVICKELSISLIKIEYDSVLYLWTSSSRLEK